MTTFPAGYDLVPSNEVVSITDIRIDDNVYFILVHDGKQVSYNVHARVLDIDYALNNLLVLPKKIEWSTPDEDIYATHFRNPTIVPIDYILDINQCLVHGEYSRACVSCGVSFDYLDTMWCCDECACTHRIFLCDNCVDIVRIDMHTKKHGMHRFICECPKADSIVDTIVDVTDMIDGEGSHA